MNRYQKIAWFNLIMMLLGSAMVFLSGFMELPALVGVMELVVIFTLVFISPVFSGKNLAESALMNVTRSSTKGQCLLAPVQHLGALVGRSL